MGDCYVLFDFSFCFMFFRLFFRSYISYHGPVLTLLLEKQRTFKNAQKTFMMVEEEDVEITFLSTNTSKLHLHVEQVIQNTYRTMAEDLRLPKRVLVLRPGVRSEPWWWES